MISYWITDSKTFNYSTDSDKVDVLINVYEHNHITYLTRIELVKGVNYYTTLVTGWNDKKVVITSTEGDNITFYMTGDKNKLSEQQKIKLNKYCEVINVPDDIKTDLCDIMTKNKSDKSGRIGLSYGHNYTKYYSQIFEKIKFDEINLFELGLGTNNINVESNMGENGFPGASIFGWNEYFRYGHIFGGDIDTGCLFNTDDIKTFYCDQTNPWIIKQMWDNKYLDLKFDIIIEDGLHLFDANVTFFENSYHKLKHNGIYIIEDINNDVIINWLDKIEEYEVKFPQFNFEIIQLDCDYNKMDNNLIKITYKFGV
jgi:SAM-dependent methyltransferase